MGARSKNNSAPPRYAHQSILLVTLLVVAGLVALYVPLPSPTGLVVSSDNATFVYDGPQQIVFAGTATMDLSPYFSRAGLTYVATSADGLETTVEGDVLTVHTNETFGEFNISIIGAVGDELLSVPLTFVVDETQETTALAQPLASVAFDVQDEAGVSVEEPIVDVENRIVRFSHEPVDLVGIESSAELVNVTPFATTIVARMGKAATPSYLTTDVFAIKGVAVDSARISLAKRGDVTRIYRCADFDTDLFSCNGAWQNSGLDFEQNETHVSFVATVFSGYAGGGEASSASTQGVGFETQGGFQTQDDVSACGSLTLNSTLTQDVSSAGTCFTISADDVTLDCQGYRIIFANSLSGYGINATARNNLTVKNCSFLGGAGIDTSSAGVLLVGTNRSVMRQNVMNLSAGIGFWDEGSSMLNLFVSNLINTSGGSCMQVEVDNHTNITDNILRCKGDGALTPTTVANLLIANNTIINKDDNALQLQLAGNITLLGNNLSSLAGGAALTLFQSTDINLTNNTLSDSTNWIDANSDTISNATISRITFATQHGQITILAPTSLQAPTTVSAQNLNITYNRNFLNSSNSNLSFLNTSAQITLNNLTLTNPRVFADFNDDGSFERCGAPDCVNISYASNVFVFNVSHFTTFEVQATNETVVNINTGERFVTIQEAIDDADTLNGHTINITGPFYSENVNVTKSLHLMGQGPSATRINSTQPNISVINITRVDNVTISRLAVTGAEGELYSGAAIWIERSNNATLRELSINNNHLTLSTFTSPIVLYFSNFTKILNSNISNNNEGIGAESSHHATIQDNIIGDNTNQSGIWFYDSTNFTIHNNTFFNNRGITFDAALHLSFSRNFLIQNNNISNSTDGIIIRDWSNSNTIIGNIISSSSVNGFYINVSNHTLLINNNITDSSGRGLYIENSVNTTAINTRIIGESLEYALTAIRANTSTFNQTTIINTSRWMVLNRTNITVNNLTFETGQGSISIHSSILNETNTINSSKLNISQNRAFLNSSNLSFLNTSAVITLNNITFARPRAIFDLEDDGTFDPCDPPQCVNVSYNNGVFVFNVTRFTTYSSDSPPTITVLGCDPDPANLTNVVTCNASVTDNVAVFNASANVTLPNGTINSTISVINITPFGPTTIFSFNFSNPNIQGQFNVTWTANDSSNNRAAGVNDSFIVNNSVNFTPTIPNQQLQVGQSITPFDLDSFFTDPDGDTLTFSVTGTGTSLITIATGGSVTITGTSSGTFTVVFSATDGINSVSSNTVTITVTSTDEGRRFGGGGGGGGGGNRTVFGAPAEFPEEILEPALAPISPEAPEEEAIPSEASEEGEPLRLPIPLAESIAGIERFGLAIRDGVTGVVRAV